MRLVLSFLSAMLAFTCFAHAENFATIGGVSLEIDGNQPTKKKLLQLKKEAKKDGRPTDAVSLEAWHYSEGFHDSIERLTIREIAQECYVTASDAEVAEYIFWWKAAIGAQYAEYEAAGNIVPAIAEHFGRAANITKDNDVAVSFSKAQIASWKREACLHGRFGGPLYRDVTPGLIKKTSRNVLSQINGLPFPGIVEIAPLSAYAEIFSEALDRGLLTFGTQTNQEVFLNRYTDEKRANVSESVAASHFASPYWRSAQPEARDGTIE